MSFRNRTRRARSSRPSLQTLEGRALLTGTASLAAHVGKGVAPEVLSTPTTGHVHSSATHVVTAKAAASTPVVKVIGTANSGGYHFVNFDGPNAGTTPGGGTLASGLANNGRVVGWSLRSSDSAYAPSNFTVSFSNTKLTKALTQPAAVGTEAHGINSAGVVVGDMPVAGSKIGARQAYFLYNNTVKTIGTSDWFRSNANGINDANVIVGDYQTLAGQFGFARLPSGKIISIHAPASAGERPAVFATGISNHGLIVGNYITSDMHQHGFTANLRSAKNGVITLTPVADPVIPVVPGEPGATLFGPSIRGVNDQGMAVGDYLDSTGSAHGFFYNTHTGKYTFLDSPSTAISDGEVTTHISGINDSYQIVGYYTDANFVAHGFVARRL